MTAKKYQQYVFSDFKEDHKIPTVMSPQAYFRGESQIPGANMNMGWQILTGPMELEKEPHTHDFDEYLIFLGWKLPDVFEFDADIDFYLGEELEHYKIDKATIVYVPAGMVHCPLTFNRIGIPILFHAILMAPKFTKTMNGKEFVFEGLKKKE